MTTQAHPRGAFVRGMFTSGDQSSAPFDTLEQAEQTARLMATLYRGVNFYTGHVGCDPREESRWQWDRDEKRVVKFACND